MAFGTAPFFRRRDANGRPDVVLNRRVGYVLAIYLPPALLVYQLKCRKYHEFCNYTNKNPAHILKILRQEVYTYTGVLTI